MMMQAMQLCVANCGQTAFYSHCWPLTTLSHNTKPYRQMDDMIVSTISQLKRDVKIPAVQSQKRRGRMPGTQWHKPFLLFCFKTVIISNRIKLYREFVIFFSYKNNCGIKLQTIIDRETQNKFTDLHQKCCKHNYTIIAGLFTWILVKQRRNTSPHWKNWEDDVRLPHLHPLDTVNCVNYQLYSSSTIRHSRFLHPEKLHPQL